MVQLAPHNMIRAMTTGVASSRRRVMALAGVSRADGPKVVARVADARAPALRG